MPQEFRAKTFFSYSEVSDLSKYCNVIGLSYSGTVDALVKGMVPYEKVQKVIAGTAIESEEDLATWIKDYQQYRWVEYKEEAEKIARQLWKDGKIEQPRLGKNPRIPMLYEGVWIKAGDENKIIYG